MKIPVKESTYYFIYYLNEKEWLIEDSLSKTVRLMCTAGKTYVYYADREKNKKLNILDLSYDSSTRSAYCFKRFVMCSLLSNILPTYEASEETGVIKLKLFFNREYTKVSNILLKIEKYFKELGIEIKEMQSKIKFAGRLDVYLTLVL